MPFGGMTCAEDPLKVPAAVPDYEPAVILSAARSGRESEKSSSDLSASDLAAGVLRQAVEQADVKPEDIGDVILGCVWPDTPGRNVARDAAARAGIPAEVPAETVNRLFGSGLQSVIHAVEATRVGYTDIILAGGVESMTNTPPEARDEARAVAAAWTGNTIADDMFQDGAAALVVATAARARRQKRRPIARILSFASTGVGPAERVVQQVAIGKALTRAGLIASDLDVIEMNERFRGHALAAVHALGLPPHVLNRHDRDADVEICPGAAGAQLLAAAIDRLRERGGGRGAVGLDAGQQMSMALIVEVDEA